MIGVSVDDTVDKLQPYVERIQDELSGAAGPRARRCAGSVRSDLGIPVNVVISRDGKICAKHTGLPPAKSSDEPLEKAVKDDFEAEIKALLPSGQVVR